MTDVARHLRIFLSRSLFDTDEEMACLEERIFPEIRRLCRERRMTLTVIDTRGGVDREELSHRRLLSVGLDEIMTRRPWIVAIVGTVPDWIPGPEQFDDPFLSRSRLPQGNVVMSGRSLVEIETLLAARDDPSMRERIIFLFRDDPNGAGKEDDPSQAFRRRVERSGLGPLFRYASVMEFRSIVRRHLLSILDRVAPEGMGSDTWVVRQRRGHDAFALSRRRSYIDTPARLAALDCHADQGAWRREETSTGDEVRRSLPLVVVGPSGSGKSALLSRWAAVRRKRHPEEFIVEHYIGATTDSIDPHLLLRRIMAEIRFRYDLADEAPTDSDTVVAEFPTWLARLQETMIVVIDAVNQADDPLALLSFLPDDFNERLRVVLSVLPGPILKAMTRRGWPSVRIGSLSKRDRQKAARLYFAELGEELNRPMLDRIAATVQSRNPLYLRTNLEALRLLGGRKRPDAQVERLLSAADVPELFEAVLKELEKEHGKGTLRSFLSLLWASSDGLSEEEIVGLLSLPVQRVRDLVAGFGSLLLRIDDRLTFCHEQLRIGVGNRYLKGPGRRREEHRKIAAWFADQPPSDRRSQEEPYQWSRADDPERLRVCLVDPTIFLHLASDHNRHRLLGYWRELGSEAENEISRSYIAMIARMEERGASQREIAELWRGSGELLMTAGRYGKASDHLRSGLDAARGDAAIEVLILDLLGSALVGAGMYQEAERVLVEALALKERRSGSEHTGEGTEENDLADTLEALGVLYYSLLRYTEALGVMERAYTIRRRCLGEDDPRAAKVVGMQGAICMAAGRYMDAERLFLRETEILSRHYGDDRLELATSVNNLGAILARQGRLDEAIAKLGLGLHLYEKHLGPHHPKTGAVLTNMAFVYRRLGDSAGAETALRRAIDIDRRMLGDRHPEVVVKLINLSAVLKQAGDMTRAESIAREAIAICAALYGPEHHETARAWTNLGSIFHAGGRLREALDIYRAYLPVRAEALGWDHPDVRLYAGHRDELEGEVDVSG